MDSSCLLCRFFNSLQLKKIVHFLFVLSSLGFFSVPVLAAGQFSFIEYNIAFVLGLSLPVLVIAVLLAKKISINWRFPATITISVLALFYSIANLVEQQTAWSLTAAMLFLSSIYLWPFFNNTEQKDAHKKLFVSSLLFISLGFITSIWLIPTLNTYFTWLIASSLILIIAFIRIVKLISTPKLNTSRMIFQWLLACFFSVSIFYWLNADINIDVVVISGVLTYLTTIINGCWLLVQQIYADLAVHNEAEIEKISSNDLFAYTHDPATNLPTHQHAVMQFEQSFKQNNNPNYAAIVFQPINFTQVNSLLGHHNSDVLLLQLAYCMQEQVSSNTNLINFENHEPAIRLARLQGLRFLILVDLDTSHHPDQAVIDDICKKLSASVPTAMSFKSFSLNFELAFGIAIVKQANQSVSKLIAQAEDALLVAQGKKQLINYFDNSRLLYTEKQLAKMEMLKKVVISEQLHWIVYPQINLTNKRIVGFALSAYWHYDNKNIELADFIKTAELSGDIYLLARQMITQAFKLLFILHQNDQYQHVGVNLSSKQLFEPDLISFIEEQRDRYNIPTKYLLVELNEELIFSENEYVKIFTDQLRALDISIVITHFSGSYDALRFLRKALVNRIKIDCQQLSDQEEMATDKAIINALINLASTMKIPLIGTNINDKFVEQSYSSMGGTLAQGTMISAGLAPEKVKEWLSLWYQQYPEAKP
ncbi:MAG: hypothetical protein COB35_12200 [Gammaproteobacteria bacterium]|nr:MAG: hypothetical protein COB35_12200 [Gammaproteobacteria bacterium]